MDEALNGAEVCSGESRGYVTMDIDEDLLAKLYAATEKIGGGTKKIYPTERQAKILRDLWGKKTVRQVDIAKAIGVSVNVARRWFEEMEADKNETADER